MPLRGRNFVDVLDDVYQGYDMTLTPLAFMKGVQIERRVFDDDQLGFYRVWAGKIDGAEPVSELSRLSDLYYTVRHFVTELGQRAWTAVSSTDEHASDS